MKTSKMFVPLRYWIFAHSSQILRFRQVLVVPIGENTLFDVHFNVVSRLRNLPLYELNRPSTWKANNQALKHFNWTTGSLLFDYLRYDRVPNGPGDLDHFQVQRFETDYMPCSYFSSVF